MEKVQRDCRKDVRVFAVVSSNRAITSLFTTFILLFTKFSLTKDYDRGGRQGCRRAPIDGQA